jgi:uncharacterized repeat protein (TIGR01451 family)
LKNIRRASVTRSPRLEPLLVADPSSFDRIGKGETRKLKLALSVPSNASLGMENGIIQLQKEEDEGDRDRDREEALRRRPPAKGDANLDRGDAVPRPLPVTVVIAAPVLNLAKAHTGNFTQGQRGATYTMTVSNAPEAGPTNGAVTVTDTIPEGLTLVSMAGTGWQCAATSCTRSDPLSGGASYAPITLTVDVAANAPASVTNTATVSGGGNVNTANDTANDITTINRGPGLTPTLVQHVASSANPLGVGLGGGPAFNMPLPNPVRAGNCLILGVSYAWSVTRTVAITDNNGNTWPAAPAVTAGAGTNTVSAIYVLANANEGQTTITVTFDAVLIPFQYTISEFYNVDTVSPVNGTSSTAELPGAALTTGNFTPGNNDADGGNLIWSYFALGQSTASQNPSLWMPGTGFTLLDADIAWNTNQGFPHATEYFVQTTSTAVNPGITASGDTNSFNCLSVALKAATAGTAPPATGIRIVRIIHMTSNVPPANTTWPLQVPTIGNLIVLAMNESAPVINVTGITDSKSNSYTLRELDATSPQIWHTANSTPDTNLTITLTISGAPATASVVAYDIVGANASPFDVVAGVASTGFDNQTRITNAPSITPTTTNGLVIAAISMGQGPIKQLDTGSPAGAVFDLVTYTGETDFDLMENADGKGHLYNSDLTQENWNWLGRSAASNTYSATAVAFKGAPVADLP